MSKHLSSFHKKLISNETRRKCLNNFHGLKESARNEIGRLEDLIKGREKIKRIRIEREK